MPEGTGEGESAALLVSVSKEGHVEGANGDSQDVLWHSMLRCVCPLTILLCWLVGGWLFFRIQGNTASDQPMELEVISRLKSFSKMNKVGHGDPHAIRSAATHVAGLLLLTLLAALTA